MMRFVNMVIRDVSDYAIRFSKRTQTNWKRIKQRFVEFKWVVST